MENSTKIFFFFFIPSLIGTLRWKIQEDQFVFRTVFVVFCFEGCRIVHHPGTELILLMCLVLVWNYNVHLLTSAHSVPGSEARVVVQFVVVALPAAGTVFLQSILIYPLEALCY